MVTRAFLAALLAFAPVPGRAQQAPAEAPSSAPPSAAATLEPRGYDYDPDGRRDPFVSLVRRGADGAPGAGTRGTGLAGLETAEVTLRGTLQSRGGFVGILAGADNRTYIVRAGDRLADGVIRSIAADAVVILQQVNDPLSLDQQREVRKTIRSADEAK